MSGQASDILYLTKNEKNIFECVTAVAWIDFNEILLTGSLAPKNINLVC